ncbi:DUF4928 family protein [Micrococcus luteus]|uniref:DUF4928 family protein n=1 Tax=Micrococcus luteus TaxID=1270 RepID=UPI001D0BF73F|nr:DUF4928 family protein [Micrococcus luteus]MCC0766392.1 DUF4928 family protein [Micrococcus luteus]
MSDEATWSELEDRLTKWFEGYRATNGAMNTNVMTAGLIVAHKAKDGLPITDDRLISKKGTQVQGLSGSSVSRLLRQHGEERKFTSEGGRTSRGTVGVAQSLMGLLNDFELEKPGEVRINSDVAFLAEGYFVEKLREEYFDRQTIEVEVSPEQPVSVSVDRILNAATLRADNPAGAVLQHLVGAKLELRFPDVQIGRDSATTADDQTDRQGDFQVGTTAFHVTMAPMEKLIQRCQANINAGFRPVIITPARKVPAAKEMASNFDLGERIDVLPAEHFIGTNIEEIGAYERSGIRESLSSLLMRYNERIKEIEVDQSLRVELPSWVSATSQTGGRRQD